MATICCTNPNATLSLTCPDPWTYCSSGTVCPNAYAWYDVCTMQVWVWVVIAIVSFIFIALVISTIFCVYHCGKRRAAEAMMEARVTTRGGEQLLLAKPGRPGAVLAEEGRSPRSSMDSERSSSQYPPSSVARRQTQVNASGRPHSYGSSVPGTPTGSMGVAAGAAMMAGGNVGGNGGGNGNGGAPTSLEAQLQLQQLQLQQYQLQQYQLQQYQLQQQQAALQQQLAATTAGGVGGPQMSYGAVGMGGLASAPMPGMMPGMMPGSMASLPTTATTAAALPGGFAYDPALAAAMMASPGAAALGGGRQPFYVPPLQIPPSPRGSIYPASTAAAYSPGAVRAPLVTGAGAAGLTRQSTTSSMAGATPLTAAAVTPGLAGVSPSPDVAAAMAAATAAAAAESSAPVPATPLSMTAASPAVSAGPQPGAGRLASASSEEAARAAPALGAAGAGLASSSGRMLPASAVAVYPADASGVMLSPARLAEDA